MAQAGEVVRDIANILKQTLTPDTRQAAEAALVPHEARPDFAYLLLQISCHAETEEVVRYAAIVHFKNIVKRYWAGSSSHVPQETRAMIKENILSWMMSVGPRMQAQLSEAITIIAREDFPENWEGLIESLVKHFSDTDINANLAVMQTMYAITKRWREQQRSDDLFLEILGVMEVFNVPFLQAWRVTDTQIEKMKGERNRKGLETALQTLTFLVKVFHNLTYQDLPDFYEENLDEFMMFLEKYLRFHDELVEFDSENPGQVEEAKTGICEIISMFTNRYEEYFKQLEAFVQTIWEVLMETPPEPKYDVFVSKAIGVLTAVGRQSRHRGLFQNTEVLKGIIQRIVIPNLRLRESDMELLEDQPLEFLRRDLEGDTDSRRRAAGDLIRILKDLCEQEATAICQEFIMDCIKKYEANPAQNWVDKDCAVSLYMAIAGSYTSLSHGAMVTNAFLNVIDFFQKHIWQDLTSAVSGANGSTGPDTHIMLKVDAVKFFYTFRSNLSKEQLTSVLPALIRSLGSVQRDSGSKVESEKVMLATYYAVCIERLFMMRKDKAQVFLPEDVQPYCGDLLENLFMSIQKLAHSSIDMRAGQSTSGESVARLGENDFLMKTVMRTIMTVKHIVVPFAEMSARFLHQILEHVLQYPGNPRFTHYLFESMAALVKYACKPPEGESTLTKLEDTILPLFSRICEQDMGEFMPYVFQVWAGMLEHHSGTVVPETYKFILGPVLQPRLWESSGNVPALVRLLQAYLAKSGHVLAMEGQLEQFLGVFNKLVQTRQHQDQAYELLTATLLAVPREDVQPRLKDLFTLILTRLLAQSKVARARQAFSRFLCSLFLSPTHSPDTYISVIEEIQRDMFPDLFNSVISTSIKDTADMRARRIVILGTLRMLTESEAMRSGTSSCLRVWHGALEAFVAGLQGKDPLLGRGVRVKRSEPGKTSTFGDEGAAPLQQPDTSGVSPMGEGLHAEDEYVLDLLDQGYQGFFARLQNVGQGTVDPNPSMPTELNAIRAVVGQKVVQFAAQFPNIINQSNISQQCSSVFTRWNEQAAVLLAGGSNGSNVGR